MFHFYDFAGPGRNIPYPKHQVWVGTLHLRQAWGLTPKVWDGRITKWLLWLLTSWWFQPILKNISQIGSSSQVRVKKDCLKPPPSWTLYISFLFDVWTAPRERTCKSANPSHVFGVEWTRLNGKIWKKNLWGFCVPRIPKSCPRIVDDYFAGI